MLILNYSDSNNGFYKTWYSVVKVQHCDDLSTFPQHNKDGLTDDSISTTLLLSLEPGQQSLIDSLRSITVTEGIHLRDGSNQERHMRTKTS